MLILLVFRLKTATVLSKAVAVESLSYSHSGTKSSGVVQPESGERLNIYAMAGSNPGLLRT